MTPSLKGGMLPDSHRDYMVLYNGGKTTYSRCQSCKEDFSPRNVVTPEGWRETQISGYCESCFDVLFEEEENEPK